MSVSATIISIFLALIFIIASVLITIASTDLYAFRTTDDNFANAYSYSTWAAVISWVLVGLVILAIFVYFYYLFEGGAEINEIEVAQQALAKKPKQIANENISGWNLLFLIIIIALLFFLGVFSAATAVYIKKSTQPLIAQQYEAYLYSAIAAVLSLVAGSLVIIWFIVDLLYYFYPAEEAKETLPKSVQAVKIVPTVKKQPIVMDKGMEMVEVVP